ncbi:MAG: sigma factor [Acidobacteriota bacterium]
MRTKAAVATRSAGATVSLDTTPVRAIPRPRTRRNAEPVTTVPKPVQSSRTIRNPEAVPPVKVVAAPAPKAERAQAILERRDRVVLEHLPLVKAIAVRVHENLPVHVEVDDLVHAGILGLFDAATKFNPEKQVAFSSYANTASRVRFWTASASSTGRHAICAAVTNK